jgi:hypothetical protein
MRKKWVFRLRDEGKNDDNASQRQAKKKGKTRKLTAIAEKKNSSWVKKKAIKPD